MSLQVGAQYQATSIIVVRADQTLESDVTSELPVGSALEIIEIGKVPSWAKIQAGSIKGWVNAKTFLNEALITKRSQDPIRPISDFEIGGQHEVISLVTLRVGENLDSEVVSELKPCTIVRIKELGRNIKRRAMVQTDTIEGWISLTTREGVPLIEKVCTGERSALDSDMSGKIASNIETMLEYARRKDLAAMQRMVEGSSGFMRQLSALVYAGIEARDHNGCTPLMFAVANGEISVTDVLLEAGARVNVKDDEGRSPLDYAKHFGYHKLAALLKEYGAVDEDSEDSGDGEGLSFDHECCAEKRVADQSQPAGDAFVAGGTVSPSGGRVGKSPKKKKSADKKNISAKAEANVQGKANGKANGKAGKGKAKDKAAASDAGMKRAVAMAAMVAAIPPETAILSES